MLYQSFEGCITGHHHTGDKVRSGIWGVNRFHGALAKNMTSYGPQEQPCRFAQESMEAWEATAAWDRARWKLERAADTLLKSSGVVISRKGDVQVPEGDSPQHPPQPLFTDDQFAVVLEMLRVMIASG